ncbi:GNAT family N-acetyltransferase [Nonomuraea glycinis]|uniref:GNAT family N-acetyltransferase n=1 Tax=Nonomuraea glycinis TaxID=2047744 RepID=UPI002E0D691C|nr:GNAT family N-acetyltransferase [Nonomuraea glycinis]
MIHEFTGLAELRAACDDDLLVWAAQDLTGRARAWAFGDAVVAAAPDISRGDRLAVLGGTRTAPAVELVRHALAELGPGYRPFGERELMRRVTGELTGLTVAGEFSWMSLTRLPPPAPHPAWDAGPVGWLDEGDDEQVAALLARHAPGSYAVPGAVGVRRWAGVRIDGMPASVAAEAWSAPSVGFLAGVATAARWRGQGMAERVCRWVSRELVAAHGRAALMVDDDNLTAIAVYERLGYRRRPVLASYVIA